MADADLRAPGRVERRDRHPGVASPSLAALVVLAALATCACGGRSAPPVQSGPPPVAAPIAFSEDPAPLPRYHSKRLALSVPLPDGRAWVIDDHSRPELVLRHDPTRSTIVAAVLRADELVGRTQCEQMARAERLLPHEDLRLLEDVIAITQGNYDTRIRVGLAPGARPDSPIIGYVTAVGGFLRKCFVFSFSTEVERAADAPVLSSRLAFARARILGGMELDAFASVPRDRPTGPAGAAPP
jgi:hypothetical protein